jgi:peptidyl-prolyl cis-trans isomerase C
MRWVLIPFLILSGCTFRSSRVSDQTVIQVNDQSMSAKEFADKLAWSLKKFDSLAAKDPNNVLRAKEEILRVFIMNSLTSAYAKANQIEITDEELEIEINRIRSSYPDDISFRRTLADEGLSLTGWKEDLRKTLLERKVFRKIAEKVQKPSSEDIQKYYANNKERFRRKERIYLRQIVSDEISKAQAIKDEVKKKDFVELAKKFSVSPEGKNGGLVGWVERGAVDIFDKAFALPMGGVSPVLESAYGFHIFKVERKAPAGYSTLEEVHKEIEQELMGQREKAEFSNWLDKQIRASRVLKDNELIHGMTVETRGS